jgi:hypothetical protein
LKVRGIFFNRILIIPAIFFFTISKSIATPKYTSLTANWVTSTQQQAIVFIDALNKLDSSVYWPNIKPASFLQNTKENILHPLTIYPGNGTNFCGYGALSYLLLKDDPLGYAKFMIQLYREGKARFGNILYTPSAAVKKEAGTLKYKGIMDIHPADQMWFLSLADHFKGYLNIFNHRYNPGDEDRFWASVNYAKFNRMLKNILHYKVNARGSDLIRPGIDDLYQYISKKMENGPVVLFINNRIVHKKNHVAIKLAVPTHFIVVEKISKENDIITLVYWDYGGKTLIQISPAFFKRIVFGITNCSKNTTDAN